MTLEDLEARLTHRERGEAARRRELPHWIVLPEDEPEETDAEEAAEIRRWLEQHPRD